jgi:hypothetical protein
MTKTKPMPLRLALRGEGRWWNAYLAKPDTMDDALQIGSILLSAVEGHPERKEAFMNLMKEVTADAIKAVTGEVPDHWNEPQSAPESERSGNA